MSPLAFRVARAADDRLGGQHPAEGLALFGQLLPAGARPPDGALTVPHQSARHRPNVAISRHHPAYRSSARRLGISSANNQRE
jgi:hypothetical protein